MARPFSELPTKDHKIEIRVTQQQKQAIQHAAKSVGKKTATWLFDLALAEANRINGADAN